MSEFAKHIEAAERLRLAYRGGAIAPLRDLLDPADGDAAYAIQAINTRHWVDTGRRIVGRKVGLTALAVQRQLGVDQPDFGVLFNDMSIGDGGVLPLDRVIQPKAEAEIAFILRHDLEDPALDLQAVKLAVEYVVPAIEIVDSRIEDWKITFADTVADNGSSGMYVLGDRRSVIDELDLWTCGMALEVDEQVVSLGAGCACLGHPLNAVAWLAKTLATRGDPLRKGDAILSGALGPMVPIVPGNSVRASIGGLGSVSFTFGKAA